MHKINLNQIFLRLLTMLLVV